jgi:hypothetical protein
MTVQLTATSSAGNVTDMLVWTDTITNTTWQPYTSYIWLPVSDWVYARFRDALGNVSEAYSDSIHPIYSPPDPPSTFSFALQPGGLSDIALSLDASAVITDAETLAVFIETTQGAVPPGSVEQLLKWDAVNQTFLAWSHEFGFGDNFAANLGDYVFLSLNGNAPTWVSLVGWTPQPGVVSFNLTPGMPSPNCALNFISLPLDQAALTNANALSDDIGGVLQALDWNAAAQNFLAWSNEFGFGDNFPTTVGYPYIVCLDDTAPAVWP